MKTLTIVLFLFGSPLFANCICIEMYLPICAKDGKTYSNECKAKCVGIETAYLGRCKDKVEKGETEEKPLPPTLNEKMKTGSNPGKDRQPKHNQPETPVNEPDVSPEVK